MESSPDTLSPFLYGTISCGADTWASALGKGRQVFSFDSRLRSDNLVHRTNYYRTKWSQYPGLDLLIVSESTKDKLHDRWMEEWGHPSRAKNILVFHNESFLITKRGRGYKEWGKALRIRGFRTHTWCVDATTCGGSVWSKYLVTFCASSPASFDLPVELSRDRSLRACKNIIRTYGIPRKEYYPIALVKTGTHPMHHNFKGTLFGDPVYHWDGPCGGYRTWIMIPDLGVRRIQLDELEKLKGLDTTMYSNISTKLLFSSIEQHVWASVGKIIAPCIVSTPSQSGPNSCIGVGKPPAPSTTPITSKWQWSNLDLSVGSVFFIIVV